MKHLWDFPGEGFPHNYAEYVLHTEETLKLVANSHSGFDQISLWEIIGKETYTENLELFQTYIQSLRSMYELSVF